MNETWNVWITKTKVLVTNNDAPLEGEAVALSLEYYDVALEIAKRKAKELGLEIEIDDIYYCKECKCYWGYHPDGTECNCPCCCYNYEEDYVEDEEWE